MLLAEASFELVKNRLVVLHATTTLRRLQLESLKKHIIIFCILVIEKNVLNTNVIIAHGSEELIQKEIKNQNRY